MHRSMYEKDRHLLETSRILASVIAVFLVGLALRVHYVTYYFLVFHVMICNANDIIIVTLLQTGFTQLSSRVQ